MTFLYMYRMYFDHPSLPSPVLLPFPSITVFPTNLSSAFMPFFLATQWVREWWHSMSLSRLQDNIDWPSLVQILYRHSQWLWGSVYGMSFSQASVPHVPPSPLPLTLAFFPLLIPWCSLNCGGQVIDVQLMTQHHLSLILISFISRESWLVSWSLPKEASLTSTNWCHSLSLMSLRQCLIL